MAHTRVEALPYIPVTDQVSISIEVPCMVCGVCHPVDQMVPAEEPFSYYCVKHAQEV